MMPEHAVSEDSFFSRWSQRKQQARGTAVEPAAATKPGSAAPHGPSSDRQDAIKTEAARGHQYSEKPSKASENAQGQEASAPPAPTMQDVERLSKDSDYSRFAQRDVAADVRNAAMKKLFADPHFNVMDGLDVYIDDYSQGETIPKAMLRQMVQARSLGLLDDDLTDQVPESSGPAADSSGTPATEIAESTDAPQPVALACSADTSNSLPLTHDDPALQLQPNPAAGPEGAAGSLAGSGGATAPGAALHGAVPARGAPIPKGPQGHG
jgi:hypothetical protein